MTIGNPKGAENFSFQFQEIYNFCCAVAGEANTWRSGDCYQNEEESDLNKSKFNTFVRRVPKNNGDLKQTDAGAEWRRSIGKFPFNLECLMSRAERIRLALSPSEWRVACWPLPLDRCISLLNVPNRDNHSDRQELAKIFQIVVRRKRVKIALNVGKASKLVQMQLIT